MSTFVLNNSNSDNQTGKFSGTGRVESLNVASAAAVLFGEYGRMTAKKSPA